MKRTFLRWRLAENMGLPSLFPWSTYSQGDLLLLFLWNISTQPNRILRCCYPSESLLIAVYLLKLGAVLILWRRMCEAKIWRATLYEGNPKPNFLNRQSLRSSMDCMLFCLTQLDDDLTDCCGNPLYYLMIYTGIFSFGRAYHSGIYRDFLAPPGALTAIPIPILFVIHYQLLF